MEKFHSGEDFSGGRSLSAHMLFQHLNSLDLDDRVKEEKPYIS